MRLSDVNYSLECIYLALVWQFWPQWSLAFVCCEHAEDVEVKLLKGDHLCLRFPDKLILFVRYCSNLPWKILIFFCALQHQWLWRRLHIKRCLAEDPIKSPVNRWWVQQTHNTCHIPANRYRNQLRSLRSRCLNHNISRGKFTAFKLNESYLWGLI